MLGRNLLGNVGFACALMFFMSSSLGTGCAKTDNVSNRALSLTTVTIDQADEEVQRRIAEYQQRVAADLTDATAIGQLGVVYELHGFSSEALDAYELAAALDPTAFRWPYYHGILLAARFDLEQAMVRIDRALTLRPDYAPALIQKGKLLLDSGQYAEALDIYQTAERRTDDPYVFVGQGLAHLGLNQPTAALAALAKAGPLTRHANVQRLRGTALIRSGRREAGAALLEGLPNAPAILWEDPVAEEKEQHAVDHFIMKMNHVARLIRAQSYESALLVLEELRHVRPENKHVLHLLSTVQEALGNDSQALATLTEGIELHPTFYVLRTAAASLLKKNGEIKAAKEHLDEAIKVEPGLHWAYAQKAQILMEEKKWMEASDLLDHAIGIKHDDADLYTYLGICLGFLDRWPEAVNLYRTAVSIDPTNVPSHIHLARAETILGNEEEALAAIENARLHGAPANMLATLERQRVQIKQMQIDRVRR